MLTLVLVAQLHTLDLTQAPWAAVTTEIRAQDTRAARRRLEGIGHGGPGEPWARAHAWSWAGQLAVQAHDLDAARGDYEQARGTDPTCFDGRMASVHLGEIALWQHRYADAERVLLPVEHDADPIVATYAAARLRGVRERPRRLALRYGSIGWIALGALALAVRVTTALRSVGARTVSRRLGAALLVTEALAVAGGVVVPRWITELAASGWMACAIPSGVAAALVWASRRTAPGRPVWRSVVTVAVLMVAMAAGLYLALDYTWWSVDDPIA